LKQRDGSLVGLKRKDIEQLHRMALNKDTRQLVITMDGVYAGNAWSNNRSRGNALLSFRE